MVESGAVVLLPLGSEDVARMKELMRKYRDLPMDLADAALVCVADAKAGYAKAKAGVEAMTAR